MSDPVTAEQVLDAVEELLRSGWTRRAWARTPNGTAVNWKSPDACQFCLTGALYRIGMKLDVEVIPFMNAMKKSILVPSLASFNDNLATDFSDILHLISQTREVASDIEVCKPWGSHVPLGQ